MAAIPHPLSFREFRLYWLARLATTIGQIAMVTVIGWQVYDIARRSMDQREAALQLGYIGVVQFLPLLALTLVVGWTADRVDRRGIVRAMLALEAGGAVVLALMAGRDTTTLPSLFMIAALLGVSRAFAGPALQGLAPNLVPPPVLPTAIAMGAIAWQGGSVFGPAIGGYLYAVAHWAPYALSAGLFVFALLAMLLVRPVQRSAIEGSSSAWRQMIDGLNYVRRNRLVLGSISLDLFAVLLGGARKDSAIFVRRRPSARR